MLLFPSLLLFILFRHDVVYFGTIIYELVIGHSLHQHYERNKNDTPTFPPYIPEAQQNLISSLVDNDVRKRPDFSTLLSTLTSLSSSSIPFFIRPYPPSES
jgi:hypothetical protein